MIEPAPPAASPARFPPLQREFLSPEQERIVSEIATGPRGEFRGPFVALIHSPPLASSLHKVGEHLRFGSIVPNRLFELGVLLVARHYGSANVWKSHRALALTAELNKAIISAIARRERPVALSDEESDVHDFCASILADGQVSDDCFERVAVRWGKEGAVDLIVLVGYYATLCHVYNIARFPLAEGDLPFEP